MLERALFLTILATMPMVAQVPGRFLAPGTNLITSVKIYKLLGSGLDPEVRTLVGDMFPGCSWANPILSDMRRVNLSARQVETADGVTAEWIIEFDGMWNWWAVNDCLSPSAYSAISYRGVPMLLPPAGRQKASSVAHIDGERMLLGSDHVLRAAIDRMLDGPPSENALLETAALLDEKWDLWAVGEGSPLDYLGSPVNPEQERPLEPRQYRFGASLSDTIDFELSIDKMTTSEAGLIVNFLRLLAGLGQGDSRAALRGGQLNLQPDAKGGSALSFRGSSPVSAVGGLITELTSERRPRNRLKSASGK